MTESKIYEIPKENFADLKATFERLARKAVKLGKTPPSLSATKAERKRQVIDDLTGERVEVAYWVYEVAVQAEPIVVEGWEFIGHVTRTRLDTGQISTTVASVPGQEIPVGLRDVSASRCDHCYREIASRTKSYILRAVDGGAIQVVGSNCIRDFIGIDPTVYARWAEIVWEADREAREGGGGGRAAKCWGTEYFLGAVAASIRESGWWSKAACAAAGRPGSASTAAAVWEFLTEKPEPANWRKPPRLEITDADRFRAAKVLAWAQEREARYGAREYERNLLDAVREGVVHSKTAGVVASLFSFYDRELNFAAERAAKTVARKAEGANSQHVGAVGERLKFTATVQFTKDLPSDFGTRTLVKFRDEEGNSLVTFTSSYAASQILEGAKESGARVTFKGTVKSHGEYSGVAETTLTRVAEVVAEGVVAAAV